MLKVQGLKFKVLHSILLRKNCVKAFTLLIIICYLPSTILSQDIHFSQYTQTPLQINPAMAGFYDGYHRGFMNYKNQWAAMGNAFKTLSASYDMPFLTNKKKKAFIGAGLSLFRDKAGDSRLGVGQINLSISGIVPLNEHNKLSAGIQTGFAQKSIDVSTLTWQSQFDGFKYDNTLPSHELQGSTSFSYLDLGAGAFYEYTNKESSIDVDNFFKINAGIAMFHINKPTQKFYSNTDKLNQKIVGFASSHYDIPETKFTLLPNVLYMKQGGISQLNVGSSVKYKLKTNTKVTGLSTETGLGIGLNYRLHDAIIPQLFYDLGNYYIGISYDYTVSSYRLVNNGRGGYEITLKYITLKNALRK